MTHEEFVCAYRDGRVRARIDRERATRLVSGRLALPFVLLPLLGLAVAAALTGALLAGAALLLLVLAFRYAVRASSQGFVLSRVLSDAAFYREALATGVLSIE